MREGNGGSAGRYQEVVNKEGVTLDDISNVYFPIIFQFLFHLLWYIYKCVSTLLHYETVRAEVKTTDLAIYFPFPGIIHSSCPSTTY